MVRPVYRIYLCNCTNYIGGGMGGGSGPSTFQTGGHGPSTFLTVLFYSKRHPGIYAWKRMHQIASFKTTFSKKLQQTPPCITQVRRLALSHQFWSALTRNFLLHKSPSSHFENRSAAYDKLRSEFESTSIWASPINAKVHCGICTNCCNPRVASFPFSKRSNSVIVTSTIYWDFTQRFFEECNTWKCRDQQGLPIPHWQLINY